MKGSGTRHRLMASLMISSQLLLAAFVLYWLWGQFREERTQLQGQLKKEYLMVHSQLIDSMLWKHLVIPEEISVNSIHLDGPLTRDSGIRTMNVTSVITHEERMVRSVKLFIAKNQEVFQSDTGVFIYAMNIDSCSLMLNLDSILEEKNWNFRLGWPKSGAGKTESVRMHGILLGGGSNDVLPALQVEHFHGFLIRKILPQILFGLILLLLSGSALLFAYRSLQRQLALNRLRDDFIGNISHELKTPVSTVKIALEALHSLEKEKDPRVSGEYLEMATLELERLEKLVAKVLDHELLDNPALVLDLELCDLGVLCRRVVRTLDLPIQEAGASVTILEEGEVCRVSVDRTYVEGMIMNLLDNSLKYAGERPEIILYIEYSRRSTNLYVRDRGPGIPEEYREQIFEKFFRIPAGNRHNVKGYGLGLNFASQVMAKHRGSISFSNLSEGGCCFTLQFPTGRL